MMKAQRSEGRREKRQGWERTVLRLISCHCLIRRLWYSGHLLSFPKLVHGNHIFYESISVLILLAYFVSHQSKNSRTMRTYFCYSMYTSVSQRLEQWQYILSTQRMLLEPGMPEDTHEWKCYQRASGCTHVPECQPCILLLCLHIEGSPSASACETQLIAQNPFSWQSK